MARAARPGAASNPTAPKAREPHPVRFSAGTASAGILAAILWRWGKQWRRRRWWWWRRWGPAARHTTRHLYHHRDWHLGHTDSSSAVLCNSDREPVVKAWREPGVAV